MATTPDQLGSPPVSLSRSGVFIIADYPVAAKRKRAPVRIVLRMRGEANGPAVDCEVAMSTGSSVEDTRRCDVAKKRARFKPATDQTGQPIAGEAMIAGGWFEQGAAMPASVPPAADAELTVSALPGNRSSAEVAIVQIIAADGRVEQCAVSKESGIASLDASACSLIAGSAQRPPIVGADGKPTRSRRTTRVTFSTS